MIKKRRNLFALVSLTIVFALAGFASAYDFTNLLPHAAYEGYDDNTPADSPPDFEQLLNGGDYSPISMSDDNRAWYSTPISNVYEFHRFEFNILENVLTIAQILVSHEGYASLLLGGPGHRLYVWNYTTAGWEFLNSTNVIDTDQVVTATINSNFADYVQGGIFQLLVITESESSCPFLYTWNGDSFEFIGDINGDGGVAYTDAGPGYAFKKTDPKDYVKIDSSQLNPENGVYKLEIAEDQDEITYLDAVSLIAVDHAPDVEIYSPVTIWYNDTPPFNIHTVKNPVLPVSATDINGKDILPVISRVDRDYTQSSQYFFDAITVDLGDLSGASQIKLVFNGWSDWPGGNEAVKRYEYVVEHPDEQMVYMPYAEVINNNGEWERVSDEEHLGMPQAKPRTMVLDITDWFKTDDYRLRINYWFKTHIDYIAVDTSIDEAVSVSRLDPVSANLYWKGVSIQNSPDGKMPTIADFDNTADITGFNVFEGMFTRYGDVLPLLTGVDDKFVIMHVGDSVSVEFNELPVAEGMERDYYLVSDAYFKGDFVKKFLGQDVSNVEPLPFHAMSNYPYPDTESYPYDAGHLAYLAEYNTREFPISPSAGEHHTIYTDYVSVDVIASSAVPTMNEWGTIIFVVVAGLGAVYFLRRKRLSN